MRQLVRFEPFTTKDGEIKNKQTFLDVHIESLDDLYENPDKYLDKLTPEQRSNLYYPAAYRKENDRTPQGFISQDRIVFDIDDIDITQEERTARAVLKALDLKWENTAVLATGYGLHIIIKIKTVIDSLEFFKQNKVHYNGCCRKIDQALRENSLPGHADVVIFDQARVLRAPGSWNDKPGREKRKARMLQAHPKPVEFSLQLTAGHPELSKEDIIREYPTPDTETVLKECDFIQWCKNSPNEVSEPQWYALASVVGRLNDGAEHFHALSVGYKHYNRAETEEKLNQAITSSGPRTCTNIDKLWGKCHTCTHYRKCKSPILVRGVDYIKTRDTGFRTIGAINPETGAITQGKVAIEDVVKFFQQQHKFKVCANSGSFYGYTGTHYTEWERREIDGFVEKHVKDARNRDRSEITNKVMVMNLVKKEWFDDHNNLKMNFKNGYLDLKTKEFLPHSPEVGFRTLLPYNYDPSAKAPRFEKFLDEITEGDTDKAKSLLEYMGYAISNDKCWEHRVMFWTGNGANGKSTLADVLRSLVSPDSYSAVKISSLAKVTHVSALDGKLFNITEEQSPLGIGSDAIDTLKALSAGGVVDAKKLWKDTYTFRNKAKLIVLLNRDIIANDVSGGFFRRMLIVPFTATFDRTKADPFMADKLIEERPGILNLLVKAYDDMLNRKAKNPDGEAGCFTCEASRQSQEAYETDADPVINWRSECVLVGAQFTKPISSAALFESYQSYCGRNGIKSVGSAATMMKQFKLRNPSVSIKSVKANGSVFRAVVGAQIIKDSLHADDIDNAIIFE